MGELVFERGSADRARGHALLYVRGADNPDLVMATYITVLPVTVDIGKYIPPLLASQIPIPDVKDLSAIPLPPIPEQVSSHDWLERLAEARDDDLIYAGLVTQSNLEQLVRVTTEATQWYLELYSRNVEALERSAPRDSVVDVDDVVYGLMGEHDRLAELVRLTGKIRDAVGGNDRQSAAEAIAEIRRLARHLPEKYRLDEFLDVVWIPGERGRKLSELHIDRCYRICNEDYGSLESIDRRIRELRD